MELDDQRWQGVCELIRGEHPNPLDRVCDEPATLRYPAMGGGYMRLCELHGKKHLRLAAALNLERWTTDGWKRIEVAAPARPAPDEKADESFRRVVRATVSEARVIRLL